MPYVRKRKQGWQAVSMLPSGKRRTETRKAWTKAQASTYAAEAEQRAVRTPWASNPGEKPRFAEYAAVTSMARQVMPSTASKEKAMWRRINAEFGDWPINTVAPSDVRLFVEALIADVLSPAYVRDIYGLVAMTFDYAVADELITQTPCVKVKLPKRDTKVIAATPSDVAAIVENIDRRYSVLVKFLAGTGARIGEALAVKVSDLVAVPRTAVRISKSVTDGGDLGSTKTSAGVRTVTLPDWLAESLRLHIAEYGIGTNDQLFPAPAGGVLPTRRFRARFWNPACEAAGAKVTAHQPRHLHASALIDAGRPLPEIAARLGHESPSVTMQVYAHWLRDDDSGSADVVPDYTSDRRTG
jgi:integrase